jgi:hypothetical protein
MKNKLTLLILLGIQLNVFALSENNIKVSLVGERDSFVYNELINGVYKLQKFYVYSFYYQIESNEIPYFKLEELNSVLKKAFYYKLLNYNHFSFNETHYAYAQNESFPRDSTLKLYEYSKHTFSKTDSFNFQKFNSFPKIGKQQYIYKSAPLTFNTWQTIWQDNSLIQEAYETYNLYNISDKNNAVKNQHFIKIINDSILFISTEVQIIINLKTCKPVHLHIDIKKSKIGEYYAFLSKKMFDENIHLTQDSLKTFYHIDMYPSIQLFKIKKNDNTIENQCYFYFKADRMNNKRIKSGYKANLHEFSTLRLNLDEIKPYLNPNSIYFEVIKIFNSK